jgi:DNA gyrase subunit A
LLANGASGIAVGMATNIPPHNLKEIIDATIHLIANPECAIQELMEFVPGPDFPTSGIINGTSGIRSAYLKGRGIVKVRGRVNIETMEKGDRERIVIQELPYQVNKARLVEKIAALVREKRLEGISDLRDESDREGIRVVLELKKGTIAQVVINTLYKNTQLQDTFGIIMLALVDQQPKILNLKEMLHHFLVFRKEVVTRRTEFDLKKAQEKEHVYLGLKIAIDNMDAVVTLIRASSDPAEALAGLIENFSLTETQGKAILEMRLQRLTGLERQKIVDELKAIINLIKELKNILENNEVKLQIIRAELTEIRKKYGDDRRTEIIPSEMDDIDVEDMIADEDVVVSYSRGGYIKRQSIDNYRSQRRGGKGIKGMKVHEEDVVENIFIASTLDGLMVFTSLGKVHWLKVYAIPDVLRTSKGKSIANLLPLKPDESIAGILSVKKFEEGKNVLLVTEKGVVKKTSLMAYSKPRQGGIIGLTVDEDDRVIAAGITDGSQDILMVTKNGFSIRFFEEEVRSIGRTGRGVRGIRLKEGDLVAGACVVQPETAILTITDKGYGKRTKLDEYPIQGRGGMGVITIKCNEKTGLVIGVEQVIENDEILVITTNGNIIRMRVNEISVIGRNTQGVRVVSLKNDNRVVCVEKLIEESET